MAESVEKLYKEMNKGLTRREISRLAQNERRKLQRRLARILSNETGEKVNWKNAISEYENKKIDNVIANEIYTDYKRLQYKTQTAKGTVAKGYQIDVRELSEKNEIRFPNAQVQARRNKMFTRELNEASKKENVGLSRLNKGEVHAFYAATRHIWGGTSIQENRNKKIMEEFGINDLETIYKLLVNKELKYTDFGFEDVGIFESWLEEIDRETNIKSLREIYQDEMNERSDEPETKYKKIAIANIIMRAAMLKNHAQ